MTGQCSAILKSNFKILILIVFLISPFFILGKNSTQPSSSDEPIKTEVEILFEKMEELKFVHMDSCLLFYKKALEISGEDQKLEGKTHLNMARVFLGNSKYMKAFEYLNKVLKIGERINDDHLLFDAYRDLGSVHWALSNLSESLDCDLKTLSIGKKLKNETFIASSTLNIGVTYAEIKDFEKAYIYHIEAKELFNKLDDDRGKGGVVNNLCRLLLDQEKYKEALLFLEQELPFVEKGDDQILYCLIQSNHAVALIANGQMEGFSQLEASYVKAKGLGDKKVLNHIVYRLSKWYLKFGYEDKAFEMAKKGIAIGKEYEIIQYLPEMYITLSKINQNRKEFKKALSNLKESNKYKDELLKKKKENEIIGMEIRGLLKQEEMENEYLQLKNTNQRFINLLLLFSFLLFIPFLYLFFKNRNRKQILKFKQKVAADLHDDIGGNLSTISRIAKGIKDQSNSNEINERVEQLVKKSNQSIRNVVDTIWSLDEKENQVRHLIDKIEDIIDSAGFRKNEIKIEFIKNIKNENQSLSMEVRHHLLMIFKEAIHNIQKHTKSNFVKLKIQQSKKELDILIYNKFQILKNTEPSTERGLENMKKRVQKIGGQIKFKKSADHFSIQINIKY